MVAPVRPPLRERANGMVLVGLDLFVTTAFGGGAMVGVAFGKLLLGAFLGVLAVGVFIRFKRRRRAR